MNKKIKHRGPDDEGHYVDAYVSLGHVRLSIIDLTEAGHQPMENEDGFLKIVFNGEIYNFIGLKKILEERGHTFKSHTDTEVILHAYEEWGERCVEKFRGMWAFAIYDSKQKKMFLSRDRFGIKPLYYYSDDNRFIFSSEMKSIFEHDIKKEPNDAVIYDFLVDNLIDHTEDTFFVGIKKIMPGYNMIYDLKRNVLHIKKYYDLRASLKKISDDIPVNRRFRESLLKAVKQRLMADVPVGSCLSGGLDSSSIVCMMREIERNKDIHTFSLVFPGIPIDESGYQRLVVEKTGVKWHKTSFGGKELLEDLKDLILTQEEPFKTLSIYGQYRVMKLARENKIKVLLDGQGSDEILAGYDWFFSYYFAELFKSSKKDLLRALLEYRKVYGTSKLILYMLIFLSRRFGRSRSKYPYLTRSFIMQYRGRKTKKPLLDARTINEASILAETYFSLPYLLRLEDKNSMRWSVESRVPFCDHELVEFTCSLPSHHKIKNCWTKTIMRESLSGLLPEKIRLRRDKIGFATPDTHLLRSEEGRELAYSIVGSDAFKSRKYWKYEKIKNMLDKHIKGKKDYASVLWKIFLTEMWLEMWIDSGGET